VLFYIAKRLLLLVIVLLGVTILTFSLLHFTPGDPAEMIAIARYGLEGLSTEQVEWIRTTEGLDAPVYVQYQKWLHHVVQGDLGRSLITGKLVLQEILSRFPATFKLTVMSMVISLSIAIPVGIISAVKQNSLMDYIGMTGALLGVSMPNFWLALLLIWLFSVNLNWLPVGGAGGIKHLILPAVTLGTGMAAIVTRLTRASMLDVLEQNYIRTARSKGLVEQLVIGKHALKNAMIPVVTVIGLQFAYFLEGAVIIETIFAWPGMGKLLVDSIFNRDYAVIQGCAILIALIFSVTNLLVDILYAFLDPRIQYQRIETRE
jgi:peptide/nickel transport system permease protein